MRLRGCVCVSSRPVSPGPLSRSLFMERKYHSPEILERGESRRVCRVSVVLVVGISVGRGFVRNPAFGLDLISKLKRPHPRTA